MDISKAVTELASNLGTAANELLPHYARWYVASAVVWIIFGVALIAAAFFVTRYLYTVPSLDLNKDMLVVLGAAVGLLGTVVICAHIPDLFSPEGVAYHQIIKDLARISGN